MSDDDWDSWGSDDEVWDLPEEDAPQLFRGNSYQIMSEKDIARNQMNAIEKVSDMLGLNRSQAEQLLQKHNWNPQKATESFMDGREEGLVQFARTLSILNDPGQQQCALCFSRYMASDFMGLECRHIFCKYCYKGYLEEQINKGIDCLNSTCAMFGCPMVISEEMYQQVLDPISFQKYKRFLLRSFVEHNSTVKWCPAPGCQNAVQYPKVKARSIICSCGYSWCFQCGNEAHAPLDCQKLSK